MILINDSFLACLQTMLFFLVNSAMYFSTIKTAIYNL